MGAGWSSPIRQNGHGDIRQGHSIRVDDITGSEEAIRRQWFTAHEGQTDKQWSIGLEAKGKTVVSLVLQKHVAPLQ